MADNVLFRLSPGGASLVRARRFRVHILHVSKNGFPARTARRRSLSSIAAAVRVYPPHRDFTKTQPALCARAAVSHGWRSFLFTIAITPGSISVAIVDLLPGIFRCIPKLPALAVSRLQGNSPWSRVMIAVLLRPTPYHKHRKDIFSWRPG